MSVHELGIMTLPECPQITKNSESPLARSRILRQTVCPPVEARRALCEATHASLSSPREASALLSLRRWDAPAELTEASVLCLAPILSEFPPGAAAIFVPRPRASIEPDVRRRGVARYFLPTATVRG